MSSLHQENEETIDEESALDPQLSIPEPVTALSPESTHTLGYMLMVCSSISLAGMAVIVHIAEKTLGILPDTALLARGIIQMSLAAVWILSSKNIRNSFGIIPFAKKRLVAVRGCVGAIGMAFFFTSLGMLPVGVAVTIWFLSPVFVLFFSRVFLKEPIYSVDCLAVLLSFSGSLFIARSNESLVKMTGSQEKQYIGLLFALCGSVFSAAAYVIQRGIGKSVNFLYSVCFLGFATIIVSTVMRGGIPIASIAIHSMEVLVLCLQGVCAFSGQCFLNKSLQLAPAGPAILIRSLDIPLVYFIGLHFLKETVSWYALFGTCLIISGTMLIGLRNIGERK